MQKKLLCGTAGLVCLCSTALVPEEYHRGDISGMVPYEMENRQEPFPPDITFEDCSKWQVETVNAVATLSPSTEKPLFNRSISGKLTYKGNDKNGAIILRPADKIAIADDANTVGVWNIGSCWMNWGFTPQMTVLVEDANGNEQEIGGFTTLHYMYYFYQRRRIPESLARPLTFTGIKITKPSTKDEATAYFDSVYFYRASEKYLYFEPFPERLPFPTRKETILPDQFLPCMTNAAAVSANEFLFQSVEPGFTLDVSIDVQEPFFDGITVNGLAPLTGAKIILDDNTEVTPFASSAYMEDGCLYLQFPIPQANDQLNCKIRLKNKSLIFDFEASADPGRIARLDLGEACGKEITNSFTMPYLTFSSDSQYRDDSATDPRVIATEDFYVFSQFDWYNSDSSKFYCHAFSPDRPGRFNGGVEYIRKTDGNRNVLREKLFLNISPDLWEVFPTIDNPPSTMKNVQADRLWKVSVSYCNPAEQLAKNTRLRNLGLDKISIRYHEDTWRDDGESYTFKLAPAPRYKGRETLIDFVADIQALGWKIGLYSNYTDLPPVSSCWDEDNASQDPDGNFHESWPRCYAPKPMWAWEMQKKLAHRMQNIYGEDHSYCDVHTSVTPFSRVDYDHRVPGAGMFRRTFECFGLILLNEKVAHKGPVFSEGINHWYYAGLSDGNYGQYYLPESAPWFPDFNLRKMHILQMDAGAESMGAMNEPTVRQIAATLIYGNIGFLAENFTEAEAMERYYLIQPLQEYYVMEEVAFTGYADEYGNIHSSSDAWRTPEIPALGRIRAVYKNGYNVSVNRGSGTWNDLPAYGWEAYSADGKTFSVRKIADGKIFEAASGKVSHYIKGEDASFGGMKIVNGAAALKLEATGWELIPGRNYESFAFHQDLIGAGNKITASAVNDDLQEIGSFELTADSEGFFTAPACQDNIFKFILINNNMGG